MDAKSGAQGTHPPSSQAQPSTSSTFKQSSPFARPPRFTAPKFADSQAGEPRAPQRPLFATPVLNRQDEVEDEGHAEEDEMLLSRAVPTTEAPHGIVSEQTDSKRRRVESVEAIHQLEPHTHRFVLPRNVSSSQDQHLSPRPAFLRSSMPQADFSDPLPDVFSPQKKGQRFVPGGLADEVQSWIFQTGNEAIQSRRSQTQHAGGEFDISCKITATDGDDPIFAHGWKPDASEVAVVLMQSNQRRYKETIKVGEIVGVKEPTWPVSFQDQTYQVAVDWKVIQRL